MNTVKSPWPIQSPRIVAFFTIPDREVLNQPCVESWYSDLAQVNSSSERKAKIVAQHPLLLQVIGAASGKLKTEGQTIGLDQVSVAVGSETAVLNSLRDLLVESDDYIVMYHEHPVPVRILLFRLLLQKRLPVIIDQIATVRRSCNLAAATSLEWSVPIAPLDVAVKAIGGGPRHAIPADGEIERAFAEGRWRQIEKHLIRSLDMTAYTYSRLAGVDPDQYRSIASTGV